MDPEEVKKQRMEFGILGKDESTNAEKLEKFSGITSWEYLKPHYEAGVLYHLDPSVSLEDAGKAFSEDNHAQVEEWLLNGVLLKIESIHAFQWDDDENLTKEQFNALVVCLLYTSPSPRDA